MKSLRLATIVLGAMTALTASGCRTAGLRDLTRASPLNAPPRITETAADLLAGHNRNASRLESLEADPAITVNGRGRVDGKLAFERERNFKLVLRAPFGSGDVADIGSNAKEFWFWVKDAADKPAVYFCNYDESGASPLASSLQPDWIVEALGLRVIPESELADTKVSAGKDPGTLLLTYRARQAGGQTFVKETVLSEESHRIREQRINSADGKTLLARAVIQKYQEVALPGSEGTSGEKIVLPQRIRLEWKQEKLTLDVSLNYPKINVTFTDKVRKERFAEPELPNLKRRNLAELTGAGGPVFAPAAGTDTPALERDQRSTVRQSMPAPPPRVRLVEPGPIGQRERIPTRTGTDQPAASNFPVVIRGVEDVVGAPIPRVSDPPPAYVQANTGWRSAVGPAIER